MADLSPDAWWGWGDPQHRARAAAAALAALRARARRTGSHGGAGAAARTCDGRARARRRARSGGSRDAVGEEWVRQDRLSRVTHAAGKGYPDLVRIRAGARRERAGRRRVPGERRRGAGGARRLRGGARRRGPVRRRHQRGGRRRAAARRPMAAWSRSTSARIDHARAGRRALADRRARAPACAAPQVEARARATRASRWVTSRSRGSTRRSADGSPPVRPARPRPGTAASRSWSPGCAAWRRRERSSCAPCPRRAAGPELRQLLVGSEGVLGVITEATVRVRPLPDATHYEGWMFKGFEQGAEAFRALEQGHVIPDVARLSDEAETRQALTLSEGASLAQRAGRAYIGARRLRGRVPRDPGLRGRRGRTSTPAGPRAAHHAARRRPWHWALRRAVPGCASATRARTCATRCSTTASWGRRSRRRRPGPACSASTRRSGRAIGGALEARGTPGRVMCHISHLYPDGASLYFTFLARAGGGRRARAVAEREVRRLRCDRGSRGHDHPSPRDRPRPRAVDAGRGR